MPKRQPRRSHQQWQVYVDKFRSQSDQTQQQFCETEGLSLGTFRKHLYRTPVRQARGSQQAARQSVSLRSDSGHFGPVTIRETDRLPSGSCLELPGNIRLHTQNMPSAEYLHDLIKVFGHGH